MKAVILFQSKTGTTKKFAENIKSYLQEKHIEVIMSPIKMYNNEILKGADYIFLGCWTNGLFFILQHPDKEWIQFAKKLIINDSSKIVLFTTFKIMTGSMFRNMRKHLNGISKNKIFNLKSKNGKLSEIDKSKIDKFLIS